MLLEQEGSQALFLTMPHPALSLKSHTPRHQDPTLTPQEASGPARHLTHQTLPATQETPLLASSFQFLQLTQLHRNFQITCITPQYYVPWCSRKPSHGPYSHDVPSLQTNQNLSSPRTLLLAFVPTFPVIS